MITLYPEPMAAYYNADPTDIRFRTLLALWHKTFIEQPERVEVGYLSGPAPSVPSERTMSVDEALAEMRAERTHLGWVSCTPAEWTKYRQLIDGLDFMAEQLLNGSQP